MSQTWPRRAPIELSRDRAPASFDRERARGSLGARRRSRARGDRARDGGRRTWARLGRRDEILCHSWTALAVHVPEPRGRSLRRSRRARYVDVRPLGASVNRYLDASSPKPIRTSSSLRNERGEERSRGGARCGGTPPRSFAGIVTRRSGTDRRRCLHPSPFPTRRCYMRGRVGCCSENP